MSQLNAHMMSHHYRDSQEANLLGYGAAVRWSIMKVRPSVKKICKNCKIVRRRRVVYVICTDARHKQRRVEVRHTWHA